MSAPVMVPSAATQKSLHRPEQSPRRDADARGGYHARGGDQRLHDEEDRGPRRAELRESRGQPGGGVGGKDPSHQRRGGETAEER
ncbi:hypothetical protein [Methylobacterium komagatae]